MSSKSDLAIFVYGSLQPGESNWPRYCEGHVAERQRACIRGRLYRLSDGYLALGELETQNPKPETLPWVCGWRLVLRSEAALRNIDRLEEFDPAGPPEKNVYLRVRTTCFVDNGAAEPTPLGEVWTYTMTPAQLAKEGAVEVAPTKTTIG